MADIHNVADYLGWRAAMDYELAGLEAVSPGPIAHCGECADACPLPGDDDGFWDDWLNSEWYELASEPSFSWSACDICGDRLGGDRSPVHGIAHVDNVPKLIHYNACQDCVAQLANGSPGDYVMDQVFASLEGLRIPANLDNLDWSERALRL